MLCGNAKHAPQLAYYLAIVHPLARCSNQPVIEQFLYNLQVKKNIDKKTVYFVIF